VPTPASGAPEYTVKVILELSLPIPQDEPAS